MQVILMNIIITFIIITIIIIITFSSHFSHRYALSPSSISPLTNCSSDDSRLWLFTVRFSAKNSSSLSYLQRNVLK